MAANTRRKWPVRDETTSPCLSGSRMPSMNSHSPAGPSAKKNRRSKPTRRCDDLDYCETPRRRSVTRTPISAAPDSTPRTSGSTTPSSNPTPCSPGQCSGPAHLVRRCHVRRQEQLIRRSEVHRRVRLVSRCELRRRENDVPVHEVQVPARVVRFTRRVEERRIRLGHGKRRGRKPADDSSLHHAATMAALPGWRGVGAR
jgi:hypothetical protein